MVTGFDRMEEERRAKKATARQELIRKTLAKIEELLPLVGALTASDELSSLPSDPEEDLRLLRKVLGDKILEIKAKSR